MFLHLALGFVLIAVSVVIHGVGTLMVIDRLTKVLKRHQGRRRRITKGALTIRVVSSLLLLHLLEASAWAALNGFLTNKLTAAPSPDENAMRGGSLVSGPCGPS